MSSGRFTKGAVVSISEEYLWSGRQWLLDSGGQLLARTLSEWSGLVRRLISDNGRKFQGREITSWCREMKITQSFTSVAYHQANGQTEVVNRIIVQDLKTRLHGKGKDCVEELPIVLWAYRTTPRAPTQETLFNLVCGSEVVLPVEIGQSFSRVESYPDNNDQSRAMELVLIEEKRDQALIRMETYRGRVMKSYNKRV
ncbi:uncharacterized protein LOC142550121 [Primulina tabacum]|uniref:uncharacterized protein LOC142550121 n=1 Tax=Primulina tabacum TaxID=48773 RepID=UPI003F59A64B